MGSFYIAVENVELHLEEAVVIESGAVQQYPPTGRGKKRVWKHSADIVSNYYKSIKCTHSKKLGFCSYVTNVKYRELILSCIK